MREGGYVSIGFECVATSTTRHTATATTTTTTTRRRRQVEMDGLHVMQIRGEHSLDRIVSHTMRMRVACMHYTHFLIV